jgi:hypothetical protein
MVLEGRWLIRDLTRLSDLSSGCQQKLSCQNYSPREFERFAGVLICPDPLLKKNEGRNDFSDA